jgi:WD40 repeat protein
MRIAKPTPTFTPILPVLAGTPMPRLSEAIRPDNMNRLSLLAYLKVKGAANQAVWSPDGQQVAVASDSGVYLFNAATRVQVRSAEFGVAIERVTFSPAPPESTGGQVAALSVDCTVRLWRTSDGAVLHTLAADDYRCHRFPVPGLALSPDGKQLAVGRGDGDVQVWRVSDWSLLHTLKRHGALVESLAFSPPPLKGGAGGETLASAGDDKGLHLWRTSDGALLRTLDGWYDHTVILSVAFAPDGTSLVGGAEDGSVRMWQVSDGRSQRIFGGWEERHKGPVRSVAFSPDGQILASGADDGTVKLWRVSDGVLLNKLEKYPDSVRSVAFSPNGQLLAVASRDGTVWFWAVR